MAARFTCGPNRDRTDDLLNAIQTRSQLRHGPLLRIRCFPGFEAQRDRVLSAATAGASSVNHSTVPIRHPVARRLQAGSPHERSRRTSLPSFRLLSSACAGPTRWHRGCLGSPWRHTMRKFLFITLAAVVVPALALADWSPRGRRAAEGRARRPASSRGTRPSPRLPPPGLLTPAPGAGKSVPPLVSHRLRLFGVRAGRGRVPFWMGWAGAGATTRSGLARTTRARSRLPPGRRRPDLRPARGLWRRRRPTQRQGLSRCRWRGRLVASAPTSPA